MSRIYSLPGVGLDDIYLGKVGPAKGTDMAHTHDYSTVMHEH